MKSIFRGTTPLLRFDFPFKYADITNLTVTFAQDGTNVFKIAMGDPEVKTIEDYRISIELTEEETNAFKHTFSVQAQVKIKTINGEVWAGDIETIIVHRILDTDIFTDTEEEEEGDEDVPR